MPTSVQEGLSPKKSQGLSVGGGAASSFPRPPGPPAGPRGPPSPPGRRERGTGPSETEARRSVRVGRPGTGSEGRGRGRGVGESTGGVCSEAVGGGSRDEGGSAVSAERAGYTSPGPGTRALFPRGRGGGGQPRGPSLSEPGEGAGLAPEPFKSARAAGRAGRPHYISRRRSTRRGRPHTPHRALRELPGA